ncbi:MAG TPA: hypothetical protein DEG17_08970 [Cyanobacteria bacterium UBA11149]|nr:hypothetical protein [Cyanobacteria bacterium UBA11367]HBE57757.1 hypothetical protein [Cyanobacteria bacterium UBA11366]HBK64043.1 hypothetical protein [Cyanobacteria bacterium UBA11166]HBR76813.1 hypothetical protein [Cyanobacteria bacterium UBA11159]HBS71379.1 hypothetical protein [Cyanobacteria bacterium UBA11153]HBW88985.1 hypothetical protein [Cyanobacteria bacterium UBA11149]HCA95206.1 hypothetical protein [Cyanobacteria bacterium UBA9226]
MTAITKPTIAVIIHKSMDEPNFLKDIETLEKNNPILCHEIIVIEELISIKQEDEDMGELLFKKFHSHPHQTTMAVNQCLDAINQIKTDIIGYIPRGVIPSLFLPQITSKIFAPWLSLVTLPQETAIEISVDAVGWILATSLAQIVLPQLGLVENWTVLAIANQLERSGISFDWQGVSACKIRDFSLSGLERKLWQGNKLAHQITKNNISQLPSLSSKSITINSKVLGIIPHYQCEVWLERCLRGLMSQTRPLDGIVVIDDGSGNPPITIVEKFPDVTLLMSPVNVGPYGLIQQAIEDTNYDAYLFQDADDWSSCCRLEKLLYAAIYSGAELIGTQELRVYEEKSKLVPVCYPLDVNQALAEKPGHPLLHPSSLVNRDLVMRLGGFATGLKFGGDTEFLLRAALVARIVNVPDYGYFRRKRSASLTTSPDTGLESPERVKLLMTLKNRANFNYGAIKKGLVPEIRPLVRAKSLQLFHVRGPKLLGMD